MTNPPHATNPLRIGLIGFGNIGSGVVHALQANGDLIARRAGRELQLVKIADLDISTDRGVKVDPALLTTDSNALIEDPRIDVIIELIGGIEPARTIIERALRAGKHVVTANKALLASHLAALLETAAGHNAQLLFEASVGGAIPCLRALQQGLAANRISSFAGILNGTCNYILTQMIGSGCEFQQALEQAQQLGYAEPNPALDISGADTAHKVAVLASLAFETNIQIDDVYCEGIAAIQPIDIAFAAAHGYAVKLLGMARRHADGAVEARVHPALIPLQSPLATVRGVFNALLLHCDLAGATLLFGRGAGPLPTASAILSDLLALAQQTGERLCGRDQLLRPDRGAKQTLPIAEVETACYLRLTPSDAITSGSVIATELARHGIRLKSFQQAQRADGELHDVLILTEKARERELRQALESLKAKLPEAEESYYIRIEHELTGET